MASFMVSEIRATPAIDPVFEAVSFWYWSSSAYALYPEYTRIVSFYNGYADYSPLNDHRYVRAVRTGP